MALLNPSLEAFLLLILMGSFISTTSAALFNLTGPIEYIILTEEHKTASLQANSSDNRATGGNGRTQAHLQGGVVVPKNSSNVTESSFLSYLGSELRVYVFFAPFIIFALIGTVTCYLRNRRGVRGTSYPFLPMMMPLPAGRNWLNTIDNSNPRRPKEPKVHFTNKDQPPPSPEPETPKGNLIRVGPAWNQIDWSNDSSSDSSEEFNPSPQLEGFLGQDARLRQAFSLYRPYSSSSDSFDSSSSDDEIYMRRLSSEEDYAINPFKRELVYAALSPAEFSLAYAVKAQTMKYSELQTHFPVNNKPKFTPLETIKEEQ